MTTGCGPANPRYAERDDAIGFIERQIAEQRTVEKSEDRAVGSDAQGQRDDRGAREGFGGACGRRT